MTTEQLGPCLQEAILNLYRLGECAHWNDFAMVGKRKRFNAMRFLRQRELIYDANEPARRRYKYKPGKPIPIVKYPARWMLTWHGKRVAKELNNDH